VSGRPPPVGHAAEVAAPEPAAGGEARTALVVASATVVAGAVLAWTWRRFGPHSRRFAFVAVWAPMAWLGTISRVITPRLPDRFHRLRGFERDGGRIYERLGVRAAKALLRRGPIATFNPGLHLPVEATPERIARLDQRMRDAEAAHALLFVATVGLAVGARARGARTAARWMLLWNVVMNGYPVMLQRYNRAQLARRFSTGA
jgi:hypothetical protein